MTLQSWPLQKAVFSSLTGNVPLMAVVTGVFDRVPLGTAYPYITIGEATAADWSTKTSTGQNHTLTLHVWSRDAGRQQAKQILDLIHTALHNQPLTLDGAALVLLQYAFSETLSDPDGITTHGVIRFRALTQSL
ncbi:MAG: DUF3168 domain-containing protein [Alphaproteobacteria bacterium]